MSTPMLIVDSWTVMSKDLKEYLVARKTRRSSLISLLIVVGLFGVFFPLQTGRAWVAQPAFLIFWLWMPFFLITAVVADSFAGERERHTLETLLASRLSDRAILLGKVGATMLYGWGVMVLCMIVSLVTVNVAFAGPLLLYPAPIALGILVLSLLSSGLAAAAGVLVSLRAATARQAQQIMSIAVLVIFFTMIYGGRALLSALPPETSLQLTNILIALDLNHALIAIALVLLALDALLLVLAMARFQRTRLILN